MNTTTSKLQLHLDNIINFMHPYFSFVNCHMVGFLTDKHWETFVPKNIQQEIQSEEDITKAVSTFWDFYNAQSSIDCNKFPRFIEFLRKSQNYRLDHLPDVCISSEKLINELCANKHCLPIENAELQIKEFMTEKKNHEVETTAYLVATLCSYGENECSTSNDLFVIDAGDGKGYLSSRLALEYKLKILGIDANSMNTEKALKRSSKLEKAWNGLTKRAEDIKKGITPPRKGRRSPLPNKTVPSSFTSMNYKTTTHFITPDTDFIELFEKYFPNQQPRGFCLSGLHTCGNLASSCIEIFKENPNIKCLCNVGCCYHLLIEEFKRNNFYANRYSIDDELDEKNFGFPMSLYLRQRKFYLDRNARMLAAQSLDRTVAAKEMPNKSLLYRALLEILITEHNSQLKDCVQVGRIKKCDTFSDYVQKCAKRCDLNLGHSEDTLNALLANHIDDNSRLNIFYLMRMTFAPILETIILLDRLLYLKEADIQQSYLVKLFDPVVSPRCYGIVSLK